MENEQFWVDMLEGMENRASYIVNDRRSDNRNASWYARKVYDQQYEQLREHYSDTKMEEIDRNL